MDGLELRRLYEAENQRLESKNRKLYVLFFTWVFVIFLMMIMLFFKIIIQSSDTEGRIPMIQVALAAFVIGLILGKMF